MVKEICPKCGSDQVELVKSWVTYAGRVYEYGDPDLMYMLAEDKVNLSYSTVYMSNDYACPACGFRYSHRA